MLAIRVALAAAVLAATADVALAQAPTMYTRWADTALTQPACVAQGRAAVAAAGFGDVTTTELSVFGRRGRCSIAVRCAASKHVVFFASASADMDQCQRLTDRVADKF